MNSLNYIILDAIKGIKHLDINDSLVQKIYIRIIITYIFILQPFLYKQSIC